MFEHVIAGIDGTDGGLDAVALARLLGAERVTLVSAYPGDPAPAWDGPPFDDEPMRQDALEDLEEARLAAGIPAEVWPVAAASPAQALHHVATITNASLICIGSSHRGRLARVLLGDVGRGVLDGAPCPVAIAPRGYAEHGVAPAHVAVGYTGTPESDAALGLAADWALEHRGAVSVDVAWEVPHRVLTLGHAQAYADVCHKAAQWAMGRALDAVPAATVDVTPGPPDEVLLDAARRADLLVIGSRSWGPEGTVCTGRTTEHLLQHAACPLVVVPRPAEPRPAPQRTRMAARGRVR